MNSFDEIFALMKANLNISEVAKTAWIDPIKPIGFENGVATFYVQTPFIKNLLQQNYTELFQKALKDILGFDVGVVIKCDDDISDTERIRCLPIPELQDDHAMVTKLTESKKNSNYQYTFETFIEGDSNKLAYTACKAAATGQNSANPLFIYGNPGLGKTHLLFAVKNEMLRHNPAANIVLIPADTFISDYVSSIKLDKMLEFKEKYRNLDVLLIDDVQFFASKKECQQELFNTFNDLHANNKKIFFTSDRAPKEINDIEGRLQSRFEWGLIADISNPEFETRLAIIQRKADLFGLKISDTIMAYIADQLKHNIRQLEGAITKMNSLSLVSDIPPTMAMAQSVINEILDENVPASVTLERIINEISAIYGFTPDEIRSKKRGADISTARQIAIYVVYRITGLSYVDIGKEFGGRDHSTIVYAVNKVKDTIQVNKAYRHKIDDLIRNVSSI
ncbi:MAG: chromosomal replication initiator protein DnaA [Oscillospiraceae bacterium]|nr:chromosomal replication initiator protein DnaA [Oscillospiraceae bacterium]